jgi:hypothetical protein
MASSTSLHCEGCGAEFTPPSGGVCAQCRRVLCERHLASLPRRRTPVYDPEPLCRECLHQVDPAGVTS